MDKRCTFRRMICGIIAIACVMLLGYGIMAGIRHDRTMHAALMQLQADNQADTIFTTDSAARALVRYFDHPWHNANDRLLAYYLLGRAHADMGEAPQAIEDYQTAIERADTTAADCDFYVLSAVYGQMAELFGRQHLYDQELDAWYLYGKCSQRAEDDQEYIRSFLFAADVYFGKDEASQAEACIKRARDLYLKAQLPCEAAKVYASDIHYSVCNHQFDDVKEKMDIYEQESMLFDSLGNIERGREIYYYDKGAYYLGVCEVDSAELWFRKLLPFPENALDAYRGLLETYRYKAIPDSIFKYSQLFEEALSDYLDMTETEAVALSMSLYNYEYNKKIAEQERRKARAILYVLIGFILLFMSCSLYILRYQKKRKQRIRQVIENYILKKKELTAAQEELHLLHHYLSETKDTELLLEQKELLIHDMESKIAQYERDFNRIRESEKESYLLNSDIVLLFRKSLEPQTVRRGTRICIQQPLPPEEKDWKLLIETFQQCLPLYYARISEIGLLTKQEYKVAILFRLGFNISETAQLLETQPSRISKVKNLLQNKLNNI